MEESFFWKNLVTDLLSVMVFTGLVAPQIYVQVLWRPYKWLEILLRKWTFWFGMVSMFLSHKLWERKFCVLNCTFGSGRLLLTLHNQLLESLHRSWGPVVYPVVADEMPAGIIGLKLCLFPWTVSWYQGWSEFWLWHPLFWVVGGMEFCQSRYIVAIII